MLRSRCKPAQCAGFLFSGGPRRWANAWLDAHPVAIKNSAGASPAYAGLGARRLQRRPLNFTTGIPASPLRARPHCLAGLSLKRILYASELGGGLGHFGCFLPVAKELERRGCAVTWSLFQPESASTLIHDAAAHIMLSPRMPGEVTGLPEPQLAYSEVLLRCGYLTVESLAPLLHKWRVLIGAAAPDMVVTDHAPTALLAARSLGLPTARFGNGFFCPPAVDPEPPLIPRMPPSAERSRDSAALVLASVNAALASVGAAPLTTLAQLHRTDEEIITTYEELDHYPLRQTPRWGAVLGSEGGVAPVWPTMAGPRVFVYLRPHQKYTRPILRALLRQGFVTLAYCPDLPPEELAGFAGPTMQFSDLPYDIAQVTAGADLVVCGAGHGTICAALLAGKPLLMVPEVVEQGINAHNVAGLGAGLVAEPGQEEQVGALLTRLSGEPGFARAAYAFRARYAGTSQTQIVRGIAERCIQLAG